MAASALHSSMNEAGFRWSLTILLSLLKSDSDLVAKSSPSLSLNLGSAELGNSTCYTTAVTDGGNIES